MQLTVGIYLNYSIKILIKILHRHGRVGRMRCPISESRISAFLKSPNHAGNRLQKPKQSLVFKFSASNKIPSVMSFGDF
jgi:hypothetical protein